MDVRLVIGAGAIGAAIAQLLADRGERVRLVTRSGGGPEHAAIERQMQVNGSGPVRYQSRAETADPLRKK